jgi:predicted NBD/HSP70 family sugar kinase
MNREPLRGNDVRQQNEKLVLSIIHKSDGISQSGVVQLTGLKPPTVYRIFSSLEEEGFIRVSEKKHEYGERKGRRPVFYRTNPRALYIIGIDFWVRSMAVVILDFAGQPVHEEVREMPEQADAETVITELKRLVEKALAESGIPRDRLLGIGIGAPGRVDIAEGTVLHYGRIRGMTRFSIKQPMEEAFDLPVYVHNNTSVIALSEYRYGVARDTDTLLAVLIRSGVGGAFINQGQILVTKGHTTMEIGHMAVNLDGPECACGGTGCLEAYLSEDTLFRELGEAGKELDLEGLDHALEREDPEVLDLLREKAAVLAEGIRSLFQLFGPDSFLLVTRSERLSRFLAGETETRLKRTAGKGNGSSVQILPVPYDPIMAGKGAADLVLDHFFT